LAEVLHYTPHEGANLSTALDIGAMIGATTMGFISDKFYGKRGPVAFVATCLANVLIYTIAFKNT
jgi:sugar phosphate permease